MSRAAALVLLVILLTVGVWFYLPPTTSRVVVFYQQVSADEPAIGQTVQPQPVFCDSGGWILSVERLTLSYPATGLRKLRGHQPELEIALRLCSDGESTQDPPSLAMHLIDDHGKEYAQANLSECVAAEARAGGQAAWLYQFRCPPLEAGATSISILAEWDDLVFCLPQLKLPQQSFPGGILCITTADTGILRMTTPKGDAGSV